MDQILFRGEIPGMSMERIRRDSGFNMSSVHFHSSYEIYFLLEGERSYFIENRTYHIGKGSLVFISPNRIHKTSVVHSPLHERILVEIEPQLMHRVVNLFCDLRIESFFAGNSGVLDLTNEERAFAEGLFSRLAEEMRKKLPAFSEYAGLLLEELLIFIFRKADFAQAGYPAQDSAKHRKVYEIAGYISEKYAEISSVSQLGRQFFISKYYLCRIFKEVTGLTISEYINDSRVKAAQKLLTETPCNITQISSAVGYESVTYFDKVFRKRVGQSPLQYRKANR
jgi:AraC-like DNA-binding protein